MGIKLFVDDMRSVPDDSWHLARTITEAIRILSGPIPVDIISLDHDIIFEQTNRKVGFSDETFASVARYIVLMPKERLPRVVGIHTANPRGCRDIEEILNGIVPTERVGDSNDFMSMNSMYASSTNTNKAQYKEDLIKLAHSYEHDGNTPVCGCDCKGCLGLIPDTELYKINQERLTDEKKDFKGEF